MEMMALKADVFLKVRAYEKDFWRVVGTKYCNIKNVRNTSSPVLVQRTYVNLHFHL